MTKKQAGRLGGLALFKKYGSPYMSKIGQNGANKMHQKNMLVPVNNSKWVFVDKESGKVISEIPF